jgi:hypothetical protein
VKRKLWSSTRPGCDMIIARRRRKGGRRKENEMETNIHEQY